MRAESETPPRTLESASTAFEIGIEISDMVTEEILLHRSVW
jgi:hypothetical protein